jgi:crotonobetainyl-CoA:carnitine CoA-transferase CaiB-like acyl-CoA transferase
MEQLSGLLERLRGVDALTAGCVAGAVGLGCCVSTAYSCVARPKPQGPLAGVVVLDVSVVIAAPFAAAVLGELGAEVIKVESMSMPDSARGLGTSPARGMGGMFVGAGRSKQSVMLNLKTEAGKAAFMELAKRCDVVLQNYRPGAVERMGIDYESVKKVNPDVIYLSSSGFGPTGPYAAGRIYDPIIQVLSGFADTQRDETGAAKLAAQVLFDKASALASAQAVAAALLARERGAGGQHITMSMLDLALQWMWPDLYWNDLWTGSAAPASPPVCETSLCTAADAGKPKASVAEALADPAVAALFETTGGSRGGGFPFFGQFRAPRFPVAFSGTPLGSRPGPPMMGEHTVKVLREAGVAAPVLAEMLAKGEAVSTPGLLRGMAGQAPEGSPARLGALKAAKAFGLWASLQGGCTFTGTPFAARRGTAGPLEPAVAGGGPMAGVVVLDLSELLAGPMAAMILADQGAECVKVELPAAPDASRGLGQQPDAGNTQRGAMFMAVNRNKKCVAVDYTTEAGIVALLPLAKTADVIFMDAPVGECSWQKALRDANPSAVFVVLKKCGGEFAVQAQSGMCADQRDARGNPTFLRTLVNEKSAAAYAAMSASCALLARQRGGAGQTLRVDLLAVALHSMTADVLMNDMWLPATLAKGSGAKAFPTIGTCYQTVCCSDGVYAFTLSLSDNECNDFLTAFEDQVTPEYRQKFGGAWNGKAWDEPGPWASIPGRIADIDNIWIWWRSLVANLTWDEFSRRCEKFGIAHGKVLKQVDVLLDEQVVHNGILRSPEGWGHRVAKPAPSFEKTPCSLRCPAEAVGASNAQFDLPPP